MGSLILEDFKIGLDRRRMNETSLAGSLVTCENAHITRGGEIEKAEAFIRFTDLPENTYGLLPVGNGFMTFGSDNIVPNILNSNPLVRFQRLNDGGANMIAVLHNDLFNGVPYVVAEYDDGIIRHFYGNTKVLDMVSGKARAKFSLSANPALADALRSTGSFVIIGPATGCSVTSILVGAIELLADPVLYVPTEDADPDGFPSRVVAAINENASVSGFNSYLQAGRKVVIESQIASDSYNGDVVAVTTAGTITIQDETPMAGGRNAQQVLTVEVAAVNILPVPVDWADSDQATAQAVAEAINHTSGATGFIAFAYGPTVLIRNTTDGIGATGDALAVTTDPDFVIYNASATFTGGSVTPTVVEPGRYNKTFKNKNYVLSESTVYYSEIGVPDNFDSGTGNGFDNLAANSSGSEVLTAMASYFENMAIFSRNNIQIWFMDDDPDKNQRLQLLNNTGTDAPESVTEFGDSDVFYLSQTGIRSLRARDTTNAAFVNDVGIAIDQIIQKELLENSAEASKAKGFLEPRQGRFQMIIGATIYVFSFYPSSKISAWSTYRPGFNIEGICAVGQTVVCRSRNALYKVGSPVQQLYDARPIKVVTPFLSGKDPSLIKTFIGMDMACQGTWDVYVATDPLRVNEDGEPDEAYYERIGTITGTTYAESGGENGHVAFDAISSHISLMLICRSTGYARLGNIAIHYGDNGEKQ